MTFVSKVLLCVFILQLKYQNGETCCCPVLFGHYNCGCNIFNCNCDYDGCDYCYYRTMAITPHNRCEKRDWKACDKSLRRSVSPLTHPDKTHAFKKAIDRVIKVNKENRNG